MFSGGKLVLLLTLFGNRVSTEKPGFSVAGPCVVGRTIDTLPNRTDFDAES